MEHQFNENPTISVGQEAMQDTDLNQQNEQNVSMQIDTIETVHQEFQAPLHNEQNMDPSSNFMHDGNTSNFGEINVESDEHKHNLDLSAMNLPPAEESAANISITENIGGDNLTPGALMNTSNSFASPGPKPLKRKRETATDNIVSTNPEVEKLTEHRRRLQEERKKILENIYTLEQDEEESSEDDNQKLGEEEVPSFFFFYDTK